MEAADFACDEGIGLTSSCSCLSCYTFPCSFSKLFFGPLQPFNLSSKADVFFTVSKSSLIAPLFIAGLRTLSVLVSLSLVYACIALRLSICLEEEKKKKLFLKKKEKKSLLTSIIKLRKRFMY